MVRVRRRLSRPARPVWQLVPATPTRAALPARGLRPGHMAATEQATHGLGGRPEDRLCWLLLVARVLRPGPESAAAPAHPLAGRRCPLLHSAPPVLEPARPRTVAHLGTCRRSTMSCGGGPVSPPPTQSGGPGTTRCRGLRRAQPGALPAGAVRRGARSRLVAVGASGRPSPRRSSPQPPRLRVECLLHAGGVAVADELDLLGGGGDVAQVLGGEGDLAGCRAEALGDAAQEAEGGLVGADDSCAYRGMLSILSVRRRRRDASTTCLMCSGRLVRARLPPPASRSVCAERSRVIISSCSPRGRRCRSCPCSRARGRTRSGQAGGEQCRDVTRASTRF